MKINWEEGHCDRFISFFWSSLLTGSMTDVTLISKEGSQIAAHQLILAANSVYFEEIFKTIQRKNSLIIILKDAPHNDLKKLVEFLYRGKLDIIESQVESVVMVAQSLQMNEAVKQLRRTVLPTSVRPVPSSREISTTPSASETSNVGKSKNGEDFCQKPMTPPMTNDEEMNSLLATKNTEVDLLVKNVVEAPESSSKTRSRIHESRGHIRLSQPQSPKQYTKRESKASNVNSGASSFANFKKRIIKSKARCSRTPTASQELLRELIRDYDKVPQNETKRSMFKPNGKRDHKVRPVNECYTPPGFWYTEWADTEKLYQEGKIFVGTPFDPAPRIRSPRPYNDYDDY